jgi:hypothetical protein
MNRLVFSDEVQLGVETPINHSNVKGTVPRLMSLEQCREGRFTGVAELTVAVIVYLGMIPSWLMPQLQKDIRNLIL